VTLVEFCARHLRDDEKNDRLGLQCIQERKLHT